MSLKICWNCGCDVTEPNRDACERCRRFAYAEEEPNDNDKTWEEQAGEDAGLPLTGPL